MQWLRDCRLVMKNSVLTHKFPLIWETASPRTHKPKIVNESLWELNHTKCYCKCNKITETVPCMYRNDRKNSTTIDP